MFTRAAPDPVHNNGCYRKRLDTPAWNVHCVFICNDNADKFHLCPEDILCSAVKMSSDLLLWFTNTEIPFTE